MAMAGIQILKCGTSQNTPAVLSVRVIVLVVGDTPTVLSVGATPTILSVGGTPTVLLVGATPTALYTSRCYPYCTIC